MQKSGFPKMHHYVGFWQIRSHMAKTSKAKYFIPIVQSRHLRTIITFITIKYIASSTFITTSLETYKEG